MENVSSSCLALVALCCADKRLLSSFTFFLTHCGVIMSCVFALSVVGSCVTDFTTSHVWSQGSSQKVIRTASPTFLKMVAER